MPPVCRDFVVLCLWLSQCVLHSTWRTESSNHQRWINNYKLPQALKIREVEISWRGINESVKCKSCSRTTKVQNNPTRSNYIDVLFKSMTRTLETQIQGYAR